MGILSKLFNRKRIGKIPLGGPRSRWEDRISVSLEVYMELDSGIPDCARKAASSDSKQEICVN